MSQTTILQVEKLSVAFSEQESLRYVLNMVDFKVEKSRCLGLVGESGSGKSMAALAIMQLLPYGATVSPNSVIKLENHSLLDCSEREMQKIRGAKIAMIFQDAMSAFNPVLTIAQQMDEVLRCHTRLHRAQRRERAMDLLHKVGIKHIKRCYNDYPHQLSGGMRQRAMIAMALCGEPSVLIADEPTTALDVTLQAQVINLLLRLKQQENLGLLFITHDLAVVSKIADDILVLKEGHVAETNQVEKFFKSPQSDYSKKLLAAVPKITVDSERLPAAPVVADVQNLVVYFPIKGGMLRKKQVVKAVDDVSFIIEQGKTLALVGESGSGKTTVAKAVIKIITPNGGKIFLNQKDIAKLSDRAMRPLRKDIQIIFQDPFAALNPRRMVVDTLIEGMRTQKIVVGKKAQLLKVDELLVSVGLLPEHKWRYPHEFSGGEKQRICIARALALQPKLLILDEPSSALDVSIQMQILKLLERLQAEQGIAYLLITHNIAVVAQLSHTIAVMHQGKIVERGETAEVLRNPQHDYTKKLLSAVPSILF